MCIYKKISEGRRSCFSHDGAGLRHFVITSGECSSREEATESFWKDYESQSVPSGGDIFWRRVPMYGVRSDYTALSTTYSLKCRFSLKR